MWVVTDAALYEIEFSPGEVEPVIDADTNRRLPVWAMTAKRLAWDEVPPLAAKSSNEYRGVDRVIRVTMRIGDEELPMANEQELADSLVFAQEYWRRYRHART